MCTRCLIFHPWLVFPDEKIENKNFSFVTFSEYFSSLVIVRFASSFCHQIDTSVTSALSTAQSKETSSPRRTILRVSAAVVGSTWRANRGDTCCPSTIVRPTPAAKFGSHVHRRDPRYLCTHSTHWPTFYASLGVFRRQNANFPPPNFGHGPTKAQIWAMGQEGKYSSFCLSRKQIVHDLHIAKLPKVLQDLEMFSIRKSRQLKVTGEFRTWLSTKTH